METADFRRVEAVHPNWSGFLRLSNVDNVILHEGPGSQGRYDLSDRKLTIFWDAYEADTFVNISGLYVHAALLGEEKDISTLTTVKIYGESLKVKNVSIVIPKYNYDVTLRVGTSDIPTYMQVFIANEYNFLDLPEVATTIVDLGANIGLATVFFANRYRNARILAVEPEEENFAMMAANVARLGARIQKQHAAVWVTNGFINLQKEDEGGVSLDAWGVRVSDTVESDTITKCFRLETLLDQAGFDTVDILKVDIEGAELEVFTHGADRWFPRVTLIIIETHDRFRPQSEAAVRNALRPLFEELPRSGENLLFRRIGVS